MTLLLLKGCLVSWVILVTLNYQVHSQAETDLKVERWVSVIRRNAFLRWESPSLWDAATWQTFWCRPAAPSSWDLESRRNRVADQNCLNCSSLFSVSEGEGFEEHNYAFMLSFYVLGFIFKLFHLFVFLCSKNIKYFLSAYSDRNTFKQ